MGDSQRFAPENSPQIAKMIVIHQNFRQYCRKAFWYPAQFWKLMIENVDLFLSDEKGWIEGGKLQMLRNCTASKHTSNLSLFLHGR